MFNFLKHAGKLRRVWAPKGRTATWLQVSLVHLLPVSITAGLIVVYGRGLSWDASSNDINGLLVFAKVYEYLIVASLSSFMLHRIRAALRSPRGVPLGFLTTPFRINAAVGSYLAGPQFSTGAWSMVKTEGQSGDFTTKILVLIVSILAIAAAPSPSILMVPKLEWWPVTSSKAEPSVSSSISRFYRHSNLPKAASENKQLKTENIWFNATKLQLYPQALDISTISPYCSGSQLKRQDVQSSSTMSETRDPDCPYAGLPGILSGLPQMVALDYIPEYVWNFTITGNEYTRHISLGWKDSTSSQNDTVTYATTPPDFISRQLHNQGGNPLWQRSRSLLKTVSTAAEYRVQLQWSATTQEWLTVIDTINTGWLQPIVATECAPLINAAVDMTTPAPQAYSATFSLGPHATRKITISNPDLLLENSPRRPRDNTGSSRGLVYVNLKRGATNAVNFPTNLTAAFLSRSRNSTTLLCLLTAKWVSSNLWLEQPFDNEVQSGISVDPSFGGRELFANLTNILTISDDWIRMLDSTSSVASNHSSVKARVGFAAVGKACAGHVREARCLASALSLYVADALARVQYYKLAYRCEEKFPSLSRPLSCRPTWRNGEDGESKSVPVQISLADMRDGFTEVSSTRYQLLYGYGIRDLTVSLAWITVILHALLVLAHIIEHVFRKKTYKEPGWSDVGELLACALESQAHGTSASMSTLKPGVLHEDDDGIWRLRANVELS